MEQQIREMLEKQLELLSEQSRNLQNVSLLPALTMCMCKITQILAENPCLS